jgi:hypothetical protein
MSETNKDAETPQPEMTAEEYHALRVKAQKELKKEIAFLRTEAEYHKLDAEIEEHKARRLKAIAIQYQLQNPQPQQMPGQTVPGKPPAGGDYDHPVAAKAPFAEKEEAPKKAEKKERTLKVED